MSNKMGLSFKILLSDGLVALLARFMVSIFPIAMGMRFHQVVVDGLQQDS